MTERLYINNFHCLENFEFEVGALLRQNDGGAADRQDVIAMNNVAACAW